MAGKGGRLSCSEVLALIPQQRPFRFIDELLEIDETRAVGRYRFRPDEFFYAGHFPGHPITPGVILMETMAQTGVVALGIFLCALEGLIEPEPALQRGYSMFCDGQIDIFLPVRPGDEVIMKGERIFWRRKKLRSRVQMELADGRIASSCELAGIYHEDI
jgi:3-hydroxyacyl-[acyl-carrier-protein] dehydratase